MGCIHCAFCIFIAMHATMCYILFLRHINHTCQCMLENKSQLIVNRFFSMSSKFHVHVSAWKNSSEDKMWPQKHFIRSRPRRPVGPRRKLILILLKSDEERSDSNRVANITASLERSLVAFCSAPDGDALMKKTTQTVQLALSGKHLCWMPFWFMISWNSL